jgi:hypothetical protein
LVVAQNALGKTLEGGWDNQHRKWTERILVTLEKGNNTTSFPSGTVFPNISKIKLVEVSED